MSEHTPGPWEIQTYMNYEGFSIIGPGGFGCLAERWESSISPERWSTFEANARLIAAAPELLAALRVCARALDLGGSTTAAMSAQREARAVIAKATHDE